MFRNHRGIIGKYLFFNFLVLMVVSVIFVILRFFLALNSR